MSGAAAAGRIVVALALLLAALLAGSRSVVHAWAVGGRSMEPGLRHGDRVLVDRWTYRQRAPRAGEVVLVERPESRPIVKRVTRVDRAAGSVWVLGDNSSLSEDSRRFGEVPLSEVSGRVVLRYWPASRAGPVR